MSRLEEAACEVDGFLRKQGWNYCLIGGVAISRWGEPRTTRDVNFCLLTGFGDELSYISKILTKFGPRMSDAAAFAEQNRVLLVVASNGVAIDISLAWSPFEEKMLSRATLFELSGNVRIPTASAEDLLITKAFASRPQDWVDVRGILVRQRDKLDWDYIIPELSVLSALKEAPEIVEQLERMRSEIEVE